MNNKVIKNKFGYYEVSPKPTNEELERYYHDKYYQDNKGSYHQAYPEDEIKYFHNRNEQKAFVLNTFSGNKYDKSSLLDIGCGEGWTLKYFKETGLNVLGVDYSTHGLSIHNPQLINNIIGGNIYESIQKLIKKGNKFDIIWLDNVLEHVLEPLTLLNDIKKLSTSNTSLVIEVPNDFSSVQLDLLAKGLISKEFWIALPDHISYFSKNSLNNLLLEAGWENYFTMSDFPIDFSLYNDDSNYVNDKTKGRNCHTTRVNLDNLFHATSVENTVKLYESFARLGVGRQIISFYKSSNL